MYVIGENHIIADNRTVLIKDLKKNDRVYVYNTETQQPELRKVLKIKQADNCFVPQNDTYRIVFTNLKRIICNSKNLLTIKEKNKLIWKSADTFISGNHVERFNKEPIEIWKIEKDRAFDYTHYLLEIEGSDNCYLDEVLISDIPH